MPQTFSPQTSVMPEMAAPTAKCSQFLRAISVEPSAPVKIGSRHLDLVVPAVLGLRVDHRGTACCPGWPPRPPGRPLAAQRIALDVQVRVVDRVVLVAAGGHRPERTGVDDLPAAERGLEDLAVAPAAVDAAGAQPGARRPRCESGSTSGSRHSRWVAVDSPRTPSLVCGRRRPQSTATGRTGSLCPART